MKKDEIIAATAELSGYSHAVVRDVLRASLRVVERTLRGGDVVRLFGIGKLGVAQRGEKYARDLRTGETVVVPPRRVVLFRPSAAMVRAANGV